MTGDTAPDARAGTAGVPAGRGKAEASAVIAQVLDQTGLGPLGRWEHLKGGLSHEIYLAWARGRRLVVRVLNPEIERAELGIAPGLEIYNTVRAAETGVGAAVLGTAETVPALVLEYLDGETLSVPRMQQPDIIDLAGQACRRLHARAEPFANSASIFRKLDSFLSLCREHGLRTPDGYTNFLGQVAQIEAAIDRNAPPSVSCHNDLLAENMMLVDGQVRIIDYQLSGMNHPCFELGDLAAESDYTPDLTERLCYAYFGKPSAAQIAQTRLFLIMSNYTWTLWFAIHAQLLHTTTSDEFDYWGEALDKWQQAIRDLTAPDFGRLLSQAARL
jgi:thiamine kinase-like enzyme